MAALRAVILFLTVLAFLVIGSPLYWLAQHINRRLADLLPVVFHRVVCRILRLRVHYYGVPSPARPQLIVPNHVSWLDILVVGAHQPVCFLAKREVAAWPIFGTLARRQGAVFVDRSRRMAIPAVNQEIARRLAGGDGVVLFPEATTGDGNRLLKFHSSHFEAARLALPNQDHAGQTMLQPVSINYVRRDGLPLGRAERATIAWYGDTGFGPHLWSILQFGSVECEVLYGTAIPFLLETDRKLAARTIRDAVQRLAQRARTGKHLVHDRDQEPATAVLLSAEKT
jgi:lyso-ornithine lipid O-acyltransferase